MGNWLVKTFIKDSENIKDESVRFQYGILTTIVAIICNLLLCVIKVGSGWIIHSVSITSDGFNNLSDCVSCVLNLIGYKVASKPADKEHPFGHGRMEYVVSFVSCTIMFVVIYQLFTDSISDIVNPEPVVFNNVLFVLLIAAILVKIWMAKFNGDLGNKLNNLVMKATAQDAKNDVFTTILSLIAMILDCAYPVIPFDGIGGLILSLFLFYSVFQMAREIVGTILGQSIDPVLADHISEEVLKDEHVLGVHDIMIHEYGPNVKFGVAHMEVPYTMSLLEAHKIADRAERRISKEYKINMTIHVDPVEKDTEKYDECLKTVTDALNELNPEITIHEFRTIPGKEHLNIIFECVLPFDYEVSQEEITDCIYKAFENKDFNVHLHIHYEHRYIGDKEDE